MRARAHIGGRAAYLVGLLYVLYVGIGGALISFNVHLPPAIQVSVLVLALEGSVLAAIALYLPIVIASEFGFLLTEWMGTVLQSVEGFIYFVVAVLHVAIVRRIVMRLRDRGSASADSNASA